MPSDMTLPLRRDLPSRQTGDELLVRDPASGQVHFLNPTAAVIWQSCDGATSVQACAEALRARFAVPNSVDLAQDVLRTVAAFERQGLITGGETPT